MKRKTDAVLLQEVKRQLALSVGFLGDEIAEAREDALNYYFQRPRGDEEEGCSQVVSGDVSAMVEANLAQMLHAFKGKRLVEFDATGKDDEDQAQLESDAVAALIMGENNGFMQLAAAIKDALLLRNGIVHVNVEEFTTVEIEKLHNVTPEALAIIETDPTLKPKVIERGDGTATIKVKRQRRRFKSEAVPLENFVHTKGWHKHDLQDIPLCGERLVEARSDLVARGFDKAEVAKLKKVVPDTNQVASARNPFAMPTDGQGLDESRDMIEWYKLYVLADRDGDGISERLKFCFSDETVLSVEEVAFVPYAAGTTILNAHRLEGISIYDKERQVQDVSTGLERLLLDNANAVTKARTAGLEGKVNPDDIDNPRANGHIRVRASVKDVRAALMALQVPDMSQGILLNLEHQRSRRSEMGGAALELSTGQMQLNDRVGSEGLDRAYSVMEQLAAMMTEIAAATLLRSWFLLAHRVIRWEYEQPFDLKVNGRWETINPSQWKERLSATVKPGMSPGERKRRADTLFQTLDVQLKLAETGMDEILVNVEGFYQTMIDWLRIMDVPNPEQYFVDPRSDSAMKAALQKHQQAQQAQARQQKLIDDALQLEQIGRALEKYKADQDTQFKYFNSVLGAEIKEAEITGKGLVDILLAKMEAKRANEQKGPGSAAPTESAAA